MVATACDIESAYLQLVLSCQGLRVEAALTPTELLRAAARRAPDVVVLDTSFACAPLRALLRTTRAADRQPPTLVVLLVADDTSAGEWTDDADVLFARPIDAHSLCAMVLARLKGLAEKVPEPSVRH